MSSPGPKSTRDSTTFATKGQHTVSISVYATKHPGTDGVILKLSCEGEDDITETVWSRNSVNIFQTTLSRSMLVYDTDSPEYQSVSGRISVSSSLQQHNVTLRTNSTLDQGSVWRCKVGQQFSNDITVELKESMQEDPVSTIGAIVSPSASEGVSLHLLLIILYIL
ncbi:uncharacterized protein LOC125383575 [Haliotis rufescens]|uniref:uncharacterized protein LOC125383575 n=1 Tax=Haliotis rufescens TaxID=6454 RepID=UPI00201F8958|nr:uncharacterized protein LOC125383575 [Haliotis rufescens]